MYLCCRESRSNQTYALWYLALAIASAVLVMTAMYLMSAQVGQNGVRLFSVTVYAESAHCLLMVGQLVYPIDRTLPMVLSYSRGRSEARSRRGAGADMTAHEVTTNTVPLSDRVERIAAQHAKFLSFLSARVEDRDAAEDILQSAYLKAVEHGSEIRDHESTVAWFYRILRNAITDHYRKEVARTRAHDAFAAEAPASYQLEIAQTVCACIGDVIHDLKSEYSTAIEQVDLRS